MAAVKVLKTPLANDNVKSFLNEARSIRLRHPNIVQILDFGLEDASHITIETVVIHGATVTTKTGTPATVTPTIIPGGSTVVPGGIVTSPVKPAPTATQGLGGSEGLLST